MQFTSAVGHSLPVAKNYVRARDRGHASRIHLQPFLIYLSSDIQILQDIFEAKKSSH